MAEAATATVAEGGRRQSRVGKRPVVIPSGVSVTMQGDRVEVKGSKGTLSMALPPSVTVTKEAEGLRVQSSAGERDAPRLQGLGRALLASIVRGVSEGYARTLELVGTGYRAEVKGRQVHLALGFSHPVVYDLPEGVTAIVPPDSKGSILHLASASNAVLGQAAATIRAYRPPEPYGGKGVRYRGENIRRKAGKAGKK